MKTQLMSCTTVAEELIVTFQSKILNKLSCLVLCEILDVKYRVENEFDDDLKVEDK